MNSNATLQSPNQQLLNIAWRRQRAYDQNASRYQRRFVFLRTLLSVLSVVVVILSIIDGAAWGNFSVPLLGRLPLIDPSLQYDTVIDAALLVIPITITALLAFSVRFDRGQNWVLLRGNAESLKMEIYYYRTQVGAYRQNRDAFLSKRINEISEGLKGSPIHQGALSPYEEEPDSRTRLGIIFRLVRLSARGLSTLAHRVWNVLFQIKIESLNPRPEEDLYAELTEPDDYLKYRLENQFDWYRGKAKKMAQQLQLFQAGVYIFGGLGTLLATSDRFNSSVAITTAMVSAFNNYLEFKRVEISLVGYNQAADTLYDIRAWWYSLSDAERSQPESFQKLVISCEETIHSENASWLQDMQDRLAQLYGSGEDESHENGQIEG
ncbi:MAG: DUF4231 domain-containing protein [Leptolyngbyaceae cyanobacterium]